jgi:hypothetical protein
MVKSLGKQWAGRNITYLKQVKTKLKLNFFYQKIVNLNAIFIVKEVDSLCFPVINVKNIIYIILKNCLFKLQRKQFSLLTSFLN